MQKGSFTAILGTNYCNCVSWDRHVSFWQFDNLTIIWKAAVIWQSDKWNLKHKLSPDKGVKTKVNYVGSSKRSLVGKRTVLTCFQVQSIGIMYLEIARHVLNFFNDRVQ